MSSESYAPDSINLLYRKIQFLEELGLNALPALQTVCLDGWLVRFAAGYTRRANSVTPLYAGEQTSQASLLTKIRYCEELYSAQNLATVFKLTSASQPPELDALLAAEGYHWHGADGVSVQTLNLQKFQPAPFTANFSQSPVATAEWLAAYCRLNGLAAQHQPVLKALLANLRARCNFVALKVAESSPDLPDQIAAVGLAVAERGYVGLFDIVTAAAMRKGGLGRQLVSCLLSWGQANGATEAYLQVLTSNTAAWQLYSSFGFADVYSYWYRVKPVSEEIVP